MTTSLNAEVNLCYFSLNNEKEFVVANDFVKDILPYSSELISVTENQIFDSNPKDSFREMVENGPKCDGLVISGHHTGSFSGYRAKGGIGIDYIESLSCEPENQEWFENLSAVWLQGCRTLGVNISPEEYEDYEETPDFHTGRLEDLLEEDSIEDNLESINIQFSDVLDQDNPLSTRYLRSFSNATVFGWTKTAPGVNAKSEYSLPYHIAHISRTLDENRPEYFVSPLLMDKGESKKRYADILMATLLRSQNGNYVLKNRMSEEILIRGWLGHGQALGHFPFSFTNPDLMAYKSIGSGKKQLKKAKKLGCALYNSNNSHHKNNTHSSQKTFLAALDKILQSERMIYYNLPKIRKILKSLEKGSSLRAIYKKKLAESQSFYRVIYKKLTSKEIGITRILEYYNLYVELTNKPNKKFEKSIRKKALNFLSRGDARTNLGLRDFKEKLLFKLYKGNIIYGDFISELAPHIKSLEVLFYMHGLTQANANFPTTTKFFTAILNSKWLTQTRKISLIYTMEINLTTKRAEDLAMFIKSFDYSSYDDIDEFLDIFDLDNDYYKKLHRDFFWGYIKFYKGKFHKITEKYVLLAFLNDMIYEDMNDLEITELLNNLYHLVTLESFFDYKATLETHIFYLKALSSRSNKEIIETFSEQLFVKSNSLYKIKWLLNIIKHTKISVFEKLQLLKRISVWEKESNNKSRNHIGILKSVLRHAVSLDLKTKREIQLSRDLCLDILIYILEGELSKDNWHYYYKVIISTIGDFIAKYPNQGLFFTEIFHLIYSNDHLLDEQKRKFFEALFINDIPFKIKPYLFIQTIEKIHLNQQLSSIDLEKRILEIVSQMDMKREFQEKLISYYRNTAMSADYQLEYLVFIFTSRISFDQKMEYFLEINDLEKR